MTATQKEKLKYTDIKWGDIICVDLSPVVGSEQDGIRPVLVISNNTNNQYAPTITICPMTSSQNKLSKKLPVHVFMPADATTGLKKDSVVLCEQVKTIDKSKIIRRVGHCSPDFAEMLKKALITQFAL